MLKKRGCSFETTSFFSLKLKRGRFGFKTASSFYISGKQLIILGLGIALLFLM